MRWGNALLASLATTLLACTASPPPDVTPTTPAPQPPPIVTIAFLFDGATGDADLVSGPALAGLELVAEQTERIEIEPVNLGEDEIGAALREVADDPSTIAAVIGPWTVPTDDAAETLAEAGLPVVSLSWLWGPRSGGEEAWVSVVTDETQEARGLLRAASGHPPGRVCAAGGRDATGRRLLATVMVERRAGGIPRLLRIGTVDPERPATASAVAGRLTAAGCTTLLWTGGVETAALLLERVRHEPWLVATSRVKTDDGLGLVEEASRVLTACVCADVTLSADPELQRFVHDFQADSASPPGPFAVEAYDAGRLLAQQLRLGSETRADVARRLTELESFPGLVGRYVRLDGDPRFLAATTGVWRARGSRWLPVEPRV